MKKIILILVVIALILQNCSLKENKKQKITLNFGILSKINSNHIFNPITNSSIQTTPIFSLLFMSLYANNKLLNTYAASKKFEDKGKLKIFYLKKNLFDSKGKRINAKDIVWGIHYYLKFSTNNEIKLPMMKMLKGAKDFVNGENKTISGIKIIDDFTFSMELNSNTLDFQDFLLSTQFPIITKSLVENPKVSVGKFYIENFIIKKNKSILVLKPNKFYKLSKENIKSLNIIFYNNQKDLIFDIKNKELDLFFTIYNTKKVISNGYDYIKIPLTGKFYVVLNPMREPFNDKNLRLFFNNYLRSLNLQNILKNEYITKSTNILPYGLIKKSIFKPYKTEDFTKYIPNREINLNLKLYYWGIRKELFKFLKKDLKKYKINFNYEFVSNKIWNNNMKTGNYIFITTYYQSNIRNPLSFFNLLLIKGFGLKENNYNNKELYNLLDNYINETNKIKRLKILWEIEKILRKESFLIPLFNPISIFGYKSEIKGIRMNKDFNIILDGVKIEKIN